MTSSLRRCSQCVVSSLPGRSGVTHLRVVGVHRPIATAGRLWSLRFPRRAARCGRLALRARPAVPWESHGLDNPAATLPGSPPREVNTVFIQNHAQALTAVLLVITCNWK